MWRVKAQRRGGGQAFRNEQGLLCQGVAPWLCINVARFVRAVGAVISCVLEHGE